MTRPLHSAFPRGSCCRRAAPLEIDTAVPAELVIGAGGCGGPSGTAAAVGVAQGVVPRAVDIGRLPSVLLGQGAYPSRTATQSAAPAVGAE